MIHCYFAKEKAPEMERKWAVQKSWDWSSTFNWFSQREVIEMATLDEMERSGGEREWEVNRDGWFLECSRREKWKKRRRRCGGGRGEGGGEVGFSLTEQWSEAKEEHTCLCVWGGRWCEEVRVVVLWPRKKKKKDLSCPRAYICLGETIQTLFPPAE